MCEPELFAAFGLDEPIAPTKRQPWRYVGPEPERLPAPVVARAELRRVG